MMKTDKKRRSIFKPVVMILLLTFLYNCQKSTDKKTNITVSIPPIKYFVDKIIGTNYSINVMLPKGQSPATHEPLPKQMERLKHSLFYFRMGLPFEEKWMHQITSANKKIKVINLQSGMVLKKNKKIRKRNEQSQHQHPDNDPHLWLNPFLVKKMIEIIYRELSDVQPDQKQFYKNNLDDFSRELDQVITEISNQLKNIKQKEMFVFHPSWGYFCDAFGLEQIAIEKEGKFPTSRELISVLEILREKKAKIIFVQPEFNLLDVKTIAQEINAKVVEIDPLAENYLENLKDVASKIEMGWQ